jgi:hypothetical protein
LSNKAERRRSEGAVKNPHPVSDCVVVGAFSRRMPTAERTSPTGTVAARWGGNPGSVSLQGTRKWRHFTSAEVSSCNRNGIPTVNLKVRHIARKPDANTEIDDPSRRISISLNKLSMMCRFVQDLRRSEPHNQEFPDCLRLRNRPRITQCGPAVAPTHGIGKTPPDIEVANRTWHKRLESRSREKRSF